MLQNNQSDFSICRTPKKLLTKFRYESNHFKYKKETQNCSIFGFMFTVQIILSMPIASCPKQRFRTKSFPKVLSIQTLFVKHFFSSTFHKTEHLQNVNYNIPLSCSMKKFLFTFFNFTKLNLSGPTENVLSD